MTLKGIVRTCAIMGTMVLLMAFTAFSAGWDDSNGSWRWINDDGSIATETWKSANGYWFYLDSTGVIAKNQMIVEQTNKETNYYYVDYNGKLMTDSWKAVAMESGERKNHDSEYWWYYFGKDGKAYKTTGKLTSDKLFTIEGKKYAFDRYGHMLYGWVNSSDVKLQDKDSGAWTKADYYFGTWKDGSMITGWEQLHVYVDSEGKYIDYWFYFEPNGKKVKSEQRVIDNYNYVFDSDGHMSRSWPVTSK
ncbi:hypothetical protein [Oribacterium sp. WCC10]|uniref:hypothetical protein n=1 Tax=Oribacterium sp. WCC10 TaxID=1855343 RepID=UPI0008E77020|nr:hypothetical protein [Oribacterium sp. WCC10]SFG30058.1 hypothetical protein SAMN05216356_10548 [Oribacterium sp. WCC10]